MIQKVKSFIKQNWFEVLVVILLMNIYVRLGEIKENTFYTADMVDSSVTRMINSLDSRLESIEDSLDTIRRNF